MQLLTILFKNPNFLILDEPTNDLDLPTLAVLEQFLIDFAGCVLLVSHDRYFMDKLVDHLFIFEGDGVIRDYPGNYTQYRILEKSNQSLASLSSDITSAKEFDAPSPLTNPLPCAQMHNAETYWVAKWPLKLEPPRYSDYLIHDVAERI